MLLTAGGLLRMVDDRAAHLSNGGCLVGTNLYRLSTDKVIQFVLRHSNASVTLGYYIKPQAHDVLAAMGKFEAEMAAHAFGDISGTVNQTSGAIPKSVN